MESGDASFFNLQIPFLKLLGVRAVQREPGRAVVALDVRPELTNSWRVAHGAVVTALLDCSMSAAARTSAGHNGGVMTVDLSVHFMRAGAGRLTAEARVLRSGGAIVFCESEVRDEAGELVAKGIGSFKLRRREDAASESESRTE
ncbi:MAG: PaaI family thioesterase [Sulfurifustis sp.]